MFELGRKPSQVILLVFLDRNDKNRKGKVFPLCDYSFRWVSTAPSLRIIALWVHPFNHINIKETVSQFSPKYQYKTDDFFFLSISGVTTWTSLQLISIRVRLPDFLYFFIETNSVA